MPETAVGAIAALTDDEIQSRVGPQSFQRGKQYFRSRAIFEPRRQGMALKARCLGSSGGPYRLRITFNAGGIAEAGCSCPVGTGGYCKHIAALLLTWRDRPEGFLEVEDVDTALEQRSKEELIALVRQMLKRDPELESLLEVPLPTAQKRSTPVDPEIYRRQAATVFFSDENGWERSRDIVEQLMAIASIGEGFARQQDYRNAAAVYEAVVLESLKHSEWFDHEGGELGDIVSECVGNLGICLESEGEAEVRQRILHLLFEIYRSDIDSGGIGMGDEALDLLLDRATREERHTIAGWVREAMTQTAGASTQWRKQAYGGLLLELEVDELDDEAFLRICRETGRTHDLVDRLLLLDRVEEATEIAQKAGDYDLLNLADIFVQHKHGDLVERLILERIQTTQDMRLLDWLKDRYRFRGDAAAALQLAEKLFRGRPDLTRYRELTDLATQAGRWDTMRPAILAFLGEQRWKDLLVAIYLEEGEVDLAVETLQGLDSQVMGYSCGLYGRQSLALDVARAAAKTRPHAALEIYGKQVERLISGRGRSSYAEAARLLAQMRDIYVDIGEDGAWITYIEDLRERHRTLRALKEELNAAGL